MPSYTALVERLYELSQLMIMVVVLGMACAIAVWFLYGKYEEMAAFLKDDGLTHKFREYQLRQLRAKRIKHGECPSHGTPLRMYGGKCPIKGCKEDKA